MGYAKQWLFKQKTKGNFRNIADSDDQNALPAKDGFSSTTSYVKGDSAKQLLNTVNNNGEGSSWRLTIHLYFKLNKQL